jgi:uncharacterized protein YidB (DUF937 family)
MDLMNLVGQVAGAAMGGGQQGGGNAAMVNAIAGMLGQQSGGIGGLVQAFTQNGMAEQAQSWVGTGENMPISPDQVQSVLGGDMIANLASQVGIPPEMASTVVSQVLPMLIDQLTPGGDVPQGDALQNGIGALLGNFLK